MKKIMMVVMLLPLNGLFFAMQDKQESQFDFELPASMLGPRGGFEEISSPGTYFIDALKFQVQELKSPADYDIFRQTLLLLYSTQDLNYINNRVMNNLPVSRESAQYGYYGDCPVLPYVTVAAVLTKEKLLNHPGYVRILREDKELLEKQDQARLLFLNPFLDATAIPQYASILKKQRDKEVLYSNIYPESNRFVDTSRGFIAKDTRPRADAVNKVTSQDFTLTSSSISRAYTLLYASDYKTQAEYEAAVAMTPKERTSSQIQVFNCKLFNADKYNKQEKSAAVDRLIKSLSGVFHLDVPVICSAQKISPRQTSHSFSYDGSSPVSNFSSYDSQNNSPGRKTRSFSQGSFSPVHNLSYCSYQEYFPNCENEKNK